MATLKVTIPENSQNILGTAIIQAPLEKVFRAYTQEELFKQWIGMGSAHFDSFDAKDGGRWSFTEKGKDGIEYSFCSSFHEVAENERIIWTFEFLGLPERGHVALERMDFIKIDEHTTEIKTTSTYQSIEDRNGMAATDMEAGWRMNMEKLEKIAMS